MQLQARGVPPVIISQQMAQLQQSGLIPPPNMMRGMPRGMARGPRGMMPVQARGPAAPAAATGPQIFKQVRSGKERSAASIKATRFARSALWGLVALPHC